MTEMTRVVLNSLSSLYPLQDYEEQAINDALQSEPHKWIPCKERLPKGSGQTIVQTNGGAIHEAFYKGKNDYGHLVWMRLDGEIYWDDEVVAWQPLPEPYKEDAQ